MDKSHFCLYHNSSVAVTSHCDYTTVLQWLHGEEAITHKPWGSYSHRQLNENVLTYWPEHQFQTRVSWFISTAFHFFTSLFSFSFSHVPDLFHLSFGHFFFFSFTVILSHLYCILHSAPGCGGQQIPRCCWARMTPSLKECGSLWGRWETGENCCSSVDTESRYRWWWAKDKNGISTNI